MSRDLLRSKELKDTVREAYSAAAARGSGGKVAAKVYEPERLAGLPSVAVDGALGVADHLRLAEFRPGETVLDIGCGAGMDTLLAARATGPAGRVIGLDFLPEMLAATAAAAAEAGLANVEPLEGDMESIPLPDASVDHVISNGVFNLSPRKARVLAECARVLRPGGRLTVSDLTVSDEELPPEILLHPATWAG